MLKNGKREMVETMKTALTLSSMFKIVIPKTMTEGRIAVPMFNIDRASRRD